MAGLLDRATALLATSRPDGTPSAALTALMPALVAAAEKDMAAAAILADAAAIDVEAAARAPAMVAHSNESTHDRLAGMADYFAERRGLPMDSTIGAIRKLSGGFSRETFLIDLVGAGATERLAIRKATVPGILDGLGVTLPQEERFIRMARDAGIPVAEPFWTETDPAVLGQPFLVTNFVGGRNVGDTLQATEPVSTVAIRNLAEALARLHSMPWRDTLAGMEAPWASFAEMDGAATIRALLARIESYVADAGLVLSPAAAALTAWLWRNVPKNGLDPVITHGDLGFHNLLMEGDRISAILDWESVVPCSPAKDLANVKPFMSAHVPWQQFLDWYAGAGGAVPHEGEMAYHMRMRMLLITAVSQAAVDTMFERSAEPDPEFLALGLPGMTYAGTAIAEAFEEDRAGLSNSSEAD